MTTQLPRPPPRPPHLQPNAKSASTAKSSTLSATASTTPASSRSSSQAPQAPAKQHANNVDYSSEKATLSLIRRTLSPQSGHGADARASPRPIDAVLPPLTSFNEIDLQLYALISVVIKEFVNSWYSKITPDHAFVEEVIQIIAHCSRALEQRLRQVAVDGLVLDEIPVLIEAHVQSYRTAHGSSNLSASGAKPSRTYHELNPHPALSPFPSSDSSESAAQQAQNEAVYRQLLVQGALAVLLPTEDLDNTCLRTLVGDIIADLILGQAISCKACEGWFVQQAITKVVEIVKARMEPKTTGEETGSGTRSHLEKYGLLSARDDDEMSDSSWIHQSRLTGLFWIGLRYVYLAFLLVRFVLVGLYHAWNSPPRSYLVKSGPLSSIVTQSSNPSSQSSAPSKPLTSPVRPILTYRIFGLFSTLVDLSSRMPWLFGGLCLCQHLITVGHGGLGSTDSTIDNYSTYSVFEQPRVFNPGALVEYFRLACETAQHLEVT